MIRLMATTGTQQGLQIMRDDTEVAVIRLHRPQRRNALDTATATALADAISELSHDDLIGAIVLTGSNSAFCSGDDLHEIATATREDFRRGIEGLQRITNAMADSPVPLVAAINGAAFGAGLELTLMCDFRLAAESASLGFPEVHWGLTVTNGTSLLLPRLIGADTARHVILEGKTMSSTWAYESGLVHEVATDNKLLDRARVIASGLAALPPVAIAQTRSFIVDRSELSLALQREVQAAVTAWSTDHARVSLARFTQRTWRKERS